MKQTVSNSISIPPLSDLAETNIKPYTPVILRGWTFEKYNTSREFKMYLLRTF